MGCPFSAVQYRKESLSSILVILYCGVGWSWRGWGRDGCSCGGGGGGGFFME